MAKWDVEIEWVAVATVRVEAATKHEAERIALDRGLPWNDAGEGYGSQTTATATCVEDEDLCAKCGAVYRDGDADEDYCASCRDNPPEGWEECGACECWHPADFGGDCRDDANRWPWATRA